MADVCDLFIIESFSPSSKVYHEGWEIASALRKMGKKPIYLNVGTVEELKRALQMFRTSRYRFIHFSCHGSDHSLTLSESGELSYESFAQISARCFNLKRVFFSSCRLGNKNFSELIAMQNLGIQSIIAPIGDISSIVSIPFWSAFYSSILLPKIVSAIEISETKSMSFSTILHNFGNVVALYRERFHISYHETSGHVLYHKKLIPGKKIEDYSFFSGVKPYDELKLK